MNIEEAILAALDYERKVTGVYETAIERIDDPAGKKIFKTLAEEERHHVDYLESRLKVWRETGQVDAPDLGTLVPSKEAIDENIGKLQADMSRKGRDDEIDLLKKALAAEIETSAFYKRMVEELPDEGRKLFSRFMEIEEGHVAIVQAEVDALTGTGFWFDFSDISLESG